MKIEQNDNFCLFFVIWCLTVMVTYDDDIENQALTLSETLFQYVPICIWISINVLTFLVRLASFRFVTLLVLRNCFLKFLVLFCYVIKKFHFWNKNDNHAFIIRIFEIGVTLYWYQYGYYFFGFWTDTKNIIIIILIWIWYNKSISFNKYKMIFLGLSQLNSIASVWALKCKY